MIQKGLQQPYKDSVNKIMYASAYVGSGDIVKADNLGQVQRVFFGGGALSQNLWRQIIPRRFRLAFE